MTTSSTAIPTDKPTRLTGRNRRKQGGPKASPQPVQEDPKIEDELADFYIKFYANGQLANREWLDADGLIRVISRKAVDKAARSYKIPGQTRPSLTDSLSTEVLKKFFTKKFGDPSEIRSFQALIRSTCHNTIVTLLRRIKSPLACRLEVEPTRSRHFVGAAIEDPFEHVRRMLGPYRFPELSMVRDVLLGFRLGSNTFPPVDAIRRLAPAPVAQAAYNAAVMDINEAVIALHESADGGGL